MGALLRAHSGKRGAGFGLMVMRSIFSSRQKTIVCPTERAGQKPGLQARRPDPTNKDYTHRLKSVY